MTAAPATGTIARASAVQHARRMRKQVLGLVLLAAVTACGGSDVAASATATSTAAAGGGPSEQARMVCTAEAQEDITSLVGVDPVRVETPTWTDGLYSCRYAYSDGAFVLSVKDLPDASATTAWFDGLAARLGHARDLAGLGERAFATTNGSVVVRKDTKVLLVDISPLPPRFGRPPVAPPDAGLLVADAILGCWV